MFMYITKYVSCAKIVTIINIIYFSFLNSRSTVCYSAKWTFVMLPLIIIWYISISIVALLSPTRVLYMCSFISHFLISNSRNTQTALNQKSVSSRCWWARSSGLQFCWVECIPLILLFRSFLVSTFAVYLLLHYLSHAIFCLLSPLFLTLCSFIK